VLRRMSIIALVWVLANVPAIVRGADTPPKMEHAANVLKDSSKKAARELSDSWLTLKTKLGLLADERVSSSEVHVTTRQGVITLDGKVSSEGARQAAGEVATNIEGADRVDNHLVVVAKTALKAVERKDIQIVKDVERRIKKTPDLKKADIEVSANKGFVTLTGDAPSLVASVHASEVASRVPGVRAVRNELAVENQGNGE
jgi:hyperosmotically inducible periplasmic protein